MVILHEMGKFFLHVIGTCVSWSGYTRGDAVRLLSSAMALGIYE